MQTGPLVRNLRGGNALRKSLWTFPNMVSTLGYRGSKSPPDRAMP